LVNNISLTNDLKVGKKRKKGINNSYEKKFLNIKSIKKTQKRNVKVFIDSKKDVKNRINHKSRMKNALDRLSDKDIKKILIKRGLIKSKSKAPINVLKDIYLNSKLLGDIQIVK